VLDSYGGLINLAELLVGLQRRTGFRTGRRGAYARPSDAVIAHLRAISMATLENGRAVAQRTAARPANLAAE
jgi:hypothetical protein